MIFGDLTSQAIVGGDPLRLTRVASPKKIGAPAPPPQPTLWDLTPGDAHGSAFEATRIDRLHGRIPQAGPCSTFRRSLLNPPTFLPPAGKAYIFHDMVRPASLLTLLPASGLLLAGLLLRR